MIFHLPLLQTVVPGNVATFFSGIIPVVMFDVLETIFGDNANKIELDEA